MSKKAKQRSSGRKIILLVIVLLVAVACIIGFNIYRFAFRPNVDLGNDETTYLYISTGSDFADVMSRLCGQAIIKDRHSFEWVARKKNYDEHINPGRYLIRTGMNNYELVNLLRSGKQSPVKVVFNNIRTKGQFISKISRQIEADSVALADLFENQQYLDRYGLNTENAMQLFIPNTYEFFWNTSAEKFFERMYKEYKRFWTAERQEKAKHIGLSQADVSVLASIVQQETKKTDEMPAIAGVYMNRLKQGMLLQADPTVIFAIGDYTIKRLVNPAGLIDSPYNTYRYSGLPPGPICLPNGHAIDAVLDYEQHDYFYFCASEDFSGYHNFARTYEQHKENARRFQQALNRLNIQ